MPRHRRRSLPVAARVVVDRRRHGVPGCGSLLRAPPIASAGLSLSEPSSLPARSTSNSAEAPAHLDTSIRPYADRQELQITAHVTRDGRLQPGGFNEIRQTLDVETEEVPEPRPDRPQPSIPAFA